MRNSILGGYRKMGSRCANKVAIATNGNAGREIRFRRFGEMSESGRAWGINEECRRRRATRNEEEYRRLARIFRRYKRECETTLREIRNSQTQNSIPGKFAGWEEVQNEVMTTGKTTDTDRKQKKHSTGSVKARTPAKKGQKGRAKKAPRGNNTPQHNRKKDNEGGSKAQ